MSLMPAGEEMDKLIAEKAMGWEYLVVGYFPAPTPVIDSRTGLPYPNDPDYNPRQEELRDWLNEVKLHSVGEYFINVKKKYWRGARSWKPSTSTSQAIKALERNFKNYQILKDTDGTYYVSTNPNKDDQETVAGETLPVAICRCLLSALGVKVTDY